MSKNSYEIIVSAARNARMPLSITADKINIGSFVYDTSWCSAANAADECLVFILTKFIQEVAEK